MTTLEEVVVAAIRQNADQIHIVPDQHVTYVRVGSSAKMQNWKQVSTRVGAKLISEAKQAGKLPVRTDIELNGEGHVYAGTRRAILRVNCQPYKGESKVVIRINAD